MKTILLLIHHDSGQEARLQTALDLARALDGHIRCVDVAQMPAQMGEFYGAAAGAMLLADEQARESANRTAIEARLAHEDVRWDWVDITGNIAACILEQAAFVDLIVLNRKLENLSMPDMHDITSTVVLKARKPVIAVPEGVRRFDVGGRALIAWNGAPPIVETMRAAVPLLALAADVRLFTVEDGRSNSDINEAAAYLSRHGIGASVCTVRDPSRTPDALIDDECLSWQADWCVMGAYGHSRLAEALFGGVTRRVLANSRLPLVLGH